MLAIPTDPAKAGNILLNYEHRQPLKYIVIVSYKLGIRDHQIIQEDVPELMAKAVPGYESYNSYVHKISPQFIKGYFDCIENKFVKNPLYDSNAEPVTTRRSQFPQVTLEELSSQYGETAVKITETNPDDWV